MAKKFPNIETLKVYQKGGDTQKVSECPEATSDIEVNTSNRERSIARATYTKSSTEDKCGNCIFFDISSRMKKCMDTKSDNKGYCWDQEFVCGKDNICDMWEAGGPIKSNDSSYMKDESEYEENKEAVEEVQIAQQMPIAGQEPQQAMPQMTAPQGPPQAIAPPQQQIQPEYKYGGSLLKAQTQNETPEWSDAQLQQYLKHNLDIYKLMNSSGQDPNDIDLSKKSTWPSVKHTIADGTYNSMLPWLPDMSTKEGKSQMYNLHRAAVNKFPEQSYNSNIYWGTDEEGGAYPYSNESITEKNKRVPTTKLEEFYSNLVDKINHTTQNPGKQNSQWIFDEESGEYRLNEGMMTGQYSTGDINENSFLDKGDLATYINSQFPEGSPERDFLDANPEVFKEIKDYWKNARPHVNMANQSGDTRSRSLWDPFNKEYVTKSLFGTGEDNERYNTMAQGTPGTEEYHQQQMRNWKADNKSHFTSRYLKDNKGSTKKDANKAYNIQQKEIQKSNNKGPGTIKPAYNINPNMEFIYQNAPGLANNSDAKMAMHNNTYGFGTAEGTDLGHPLFNLIGNAFASPRNSMMAASLPMILKASSSIPLGYGLTSGNLINAGFAGNAIVNTLPNAYEDYQNEDYGSMATNLGFGALELSGLNRMGLNVMPKNYSALTKMNPTFPAMNFKGQNVMNKNLNVLQGNKHFSQIPLTSQLKEMNSFAKTNFTNSLLNPTFKPSLIPKQIGGSLRKAQESLEIDYTIDPATGQPFDQTPVESMADRTIRLEAEAEEKRLAGLDNNTDIYDAANKEEGNTIKNKFKDWRTNRGNRRRNRSITQDQNFIPWNAPPEQGIAGQIGNWFKSVNQEFNDYDVDPNKITNKEFRNYKNILKEQNPDMSRKEIKALAKTQFPSAGSNRWGKENYQQFKVTNPFDEDRYFDPANPDELITHGEKNSRSYDAFTSNRVALYPELYQKSTMNENGEIIYTGEKLLGDMYETEYMPDVQSIEYNEDGTGIRGGNFYTGTSEDGVKQYQFVPFDPANPTEIQYTKNGQQNENDCITLMNKCKNSTPPGVWDGANCTCTGVDGTKQSDINKEFDGKPLDISFDKDKSFGKKKQYGGGLFKAQNGAQDVAAMYQVNPEQFDYDTNMPKEGAISSYGDVWQGGQWVDATVEQQGFNTPDSEQFGDVSSAFSDETGVTNRNANYDPDRAYPFSANAINQDIKSAAANTYDVRRRDIDMNTYKPEDGSINKSHGSIFDNEDGQFNDNQFTPQIDFTDDFAFKGDNNTLSRGQLRDVRKDNRRQGKAEDKGFESWEAMQIAKDEAKMLKKQQRKDKRDRWGDNFGERLGNKFNYMMDSKAMQTYGKGSKAIVEGAAIGNNIYDILNEDKEQTALLSTRSADDVYGVTSADALSRGEHDENTGIFQPDDKVISRWGKYGIELPRAQSQTETGFQVAGPLYDLNGKCYANCTQRSYLPEHNLSIGTKFNADKVDDQWGIGMGAYAGYSLNPLIQGRRQEGLKGYLGANYGARLSDLSMSGLEQGVDPTITPYSEAVASVGYEGEVGDAGSYANYLRGRRGDPLKWGLGAFGKYDIMDDKGLTVGGYGNYGNLNANVAYNPNSGWAATLGFGMPIRKQGGEQKTINVNSDMYYELIAAGADLEII